MIRDNKIKINISYRNVSHYLKLGYDAIINNDLEILTIDLPRVSHVKIDVICEICKKPNQIMYCKYIDNKNRHGFYGCKSCSRQKAVITSRRLYGVDNYTMLDESKEKVALNNIKKYGVKTTLLEKQTMSKIKDTMFKNYGTDKFYEIRRRNKNLKFIFLDLETKENNIEDPIDRYTEIFGESYLLYRNEVRRLSKKPAKKLYENWDGLDYYDREDISINFNLPHNNPNFPTIDHKVSVYYGFKNNIPPSEIADISNLCITKRSINSSKRDLSESNFNILL